MDKLVGHDQDDGESGEKLASELQAIQLEREQTSIAPFVLELSLDDRSAFTSVMGKLSLVNMVRAIGPLARHHAARGGTFSDSERRIIELLGNLADDESNKGRKLSDLDLQFRWVSAGPDVTVDKIVESAPVHGGNPSTDASGWVHVGKSVVEDFMANPAHDDPGVLLVYDGSKLEPITRDDADADWNNPEGKHTYMHAQKPIPGLELKDALVGMISFDESHEHNRQGSD